MIRIKSGRSLVVYLSTLLGLTLPNSWAWAGCGDSFVPPSSIRHQVHGEKNQETIVLVHGLGGSIEAWTDTAVVESLVRHNFRVVVYDQPGHGDTTPIGVDYSSKTMADTLKHLLDQLGIEKAHIVGHSMGARTAMRFAHDYPDRVGAIVLEDMHMKSLARSSYLKRSLETAAKLEALPTTEFESQHAAWLAMQPVLGHELAAKIVKDHLMRGVDGKWRPQGYLLYEAHGLREDLTETMQNTAAPMLFLAADPEHRNWFGQHTVVLFGQGIEHIQTHKPDAQIEMVPNAGHGIHYDQTSTFVNKIVSFIKGDVRQ